ncbi:MAG: LytTR family DNA-binding domain-containing protein [Bacteroidota bacterium]
MSSRPPLKVWLIEDEPPAMRRLERLIAELRPTYEVVFKSDSVADTLDILKNVPQPDLIFSDIQLADGLSFDIWDKQTNMSCPIIFTTAFDQYSLQAFQVNGIDYLLKPIEPDQLEKSLQKHERLSTPPANTVDWQKLTAILETGQVSYRKRFLVQHRKDWLPIQTREVSQIYSEDSLTFLLCHDGKRFMLSEPLDKLERELDPQHWFRINRSQIVHARSVIRISPYFNHRLKLDLKPSVDMENLVSRQRVKAFKAWMGNG